MSSSALFEAPGQMAGFVVIGAETPYTSSRCFFDVEKTPAGQDNPVTRLDQRNGQVIAIVSGPTCLGNTGGDRTDQGSESCHANSFSMVYRRIAGHFE
jgi:hypothetical protein